MKKADIKPGVVYAYQRGRGRYEEPQPIVFLNTPADGKLYRTSSYHRPSGTPAFHAAHSGAKPHLGRGYSDSDVGYPGVRLRWDAKGKPEDLLKVRLADFEAATSSYREDGIEFAVITSLAAITGVYTEEKAAYDSHRQAEHEKAQRDNAAADASRTRAIDILTALRAHGIEPKRISAYGSVDAIEIPLDEAEKLIALLAAKDAREG